MQAARLPSLRFRLGLFQLAPAQDLLLAGNLFFRKHRPAAALDATITSSVFAGLTIVEIVIVGQLFSGLNVAQGDDPDAAAKLVGFTIWITAMVHKGGGA